MTNSFFYEGVKPGGLTSSQEIRILICYMLDKIDTAVTRQQLEEVLLGEELVNYFVMADSLAQVVTAGLVQDTADGYLITEAGRTVADTLAADVPRSVRDTAVRGVIQAQHYAAKAAVHKSDIVKKDGGFEVRCYIEDESGILFSMALYMPDELSATAVKEKFISEGDSVYKLMLATLTGNQNIIEETLKELK